MIVNVEFFDANPIENVITSLNYKLDKTIFFGYEETMCAQSRTICSFLTDVCAVPSVEFYPVSKTELSDILETISTQVKKELDNGNQVYFDLTGGESLPLVAFGILASEFCAPMYIFDIKTNALKEYNCHKVIPLSQAAQKRSLNMNLDQFIALYGGSINQKHKKSFKSLKPEQAADIEHMWNLSRSYDKRWVYYSAVIRQFPPGDNLEVYVDQIKFLAEYNKNRRAGNIKGFHRFLKDCEAMGFIQILSLGKKGYHFCYRDSFIKEILWDSGSILEMYAFLLESRDPEVTDCRVGVHIDWDGVVHQGGNRDVLNEIDVMSIRGNLPTFMSCKIGNVDQMALYELETIASRFGGSYAGKVLSVAKELPPAHLRRAREMGIRVQVLR